MKKYLFYGFFTFLSIQSQQLQSDILNKMLEPVDCTLHGIQNFISGKYNHSDYKNFLGSCFVHMIDLLEYAHKYCNDPLFVKQVFDIFTQKIKESNWINPYALIYFIEHTQHIMIDLINKIDTSSTETIISEHLTQALSDDFSLLQSNPKAFIEKHSHEISVKTSQSKKAHVNMHYSYMSFLQSALDKILFDTNEQTDSWICCTTLLNMIKQINELSLIPQESMYQQFLWSICTRFIYCIELNSLIFTPLTYQNIIDQLQQKLIPALESIEIEELLIPKREWLLTNIKQLSIKKAST